MIPGAGDIVVVVVGVVVVRLVVGTEVAGTVVFIDVVTVVVSGQGPQGPPQSILVSL